MSVLHAPRKPEVDRRLIWFPVIIIPLFFMIVLRLWYLQVVRAPELVDEAARSRRVSINVLAPRGMIYDRRGKVLAGVKPEFVVTLLPSVLRKNKEVVGKLAGLLEMPVEEVERRVKLGAWRNAPAPIKAGVSVETATMIAEATDLPGVAIEEKPMRVYTDQTNFTHVMGYVGALTGRDEKRLKEMDIQPAEFIGRGGIEQAYEPQLMGVPGAQNMESRGSAKLASRELATPGKQLFLTLDADLQAYAQTVLSSRGWKGSIVAIEPSTGEVLAMVSNPSYSLGIYENGLSTEEYSSLLNKANGLPLLNRPIQGEYAPGSTYKIVTAIAAYKAGKLDRGTYAYCNGAFSFGKGRPLKCMGTHGSVGFGEAMARSCNTYFCTLGTRTGSDMLMKISHECGVGEPTGVELRGESKGILPDEEWREKRPKERTWNLGQLANMSIGQGYLNTTPIQMANIAAMVANDGVRYRPHLVRAFRDPITGEDSYVKPEQIGKIDAEPWFWDMLKDGLVGVISHGTATRYAAINGLQWGGKTGSAEHGRKGANNTHAWFVGFAPRTNPKIAICAMAEDAGHGGDAAAPLAAEVVRHYLMRPDAASSNRVASTAGSKSPRRG